MAKHTLKFSGLRVNFLIFCYEQVEEALPSYLKLYDIVLGNDAPMDIVNVLLHLLTKSS